MKKNISILLALAMCLALAIPALANETTSIADMESRIATEENALRSNLAQFTEVECALRNEEVALVADIAAAKGEAETVQPRSTIERVRSYCYFLTDYDGNSVFTDWVYKDIVVPNGKTLVCVQEDKIASINYDAWYNNVKYKIVTKLECIYELQ